MSNVRRQEVESAMFGIGLLVLLVIAAVLLYWASKLFPGWKAKSAFVVVVIGGVVGYPFAYKLYPSYTKFLELCESSDRYQVLRTKTADYIYLDREVGSLCLGGPKLIGSLPFAGFDCVGASSRTTTAVFRYTKKANWRLGCGIECFESKLQDVPEAKYEQGYRQGYVARGVATVTFDGTGIRAPESSGDKLRFRDTLLVDNGTVMAFTRTYDFYPYGSGWASILGGASGSAPSQSCKGPFRHWNILDVYKPKADA